MKVLIILILFIQLMRLVKTKAKEIEDKKRYLKYLEETKLMLERYSEW